MADQKMIRIGQAAKKLNVGHSTIIEQLKKKNIEIDSPSPNGKITVEQFEVLKKMNAKSMQEKEEAAQISISSQVGNTVIESKKKKGKKTEEKEDDHLIIKNSSASSEDTKSDKEKKVQDKPEPETYSARPSLKVVGKIDLNENKKQEAKPTAKKETPKPEAKKPAAPKKEAPKAEKPKAEEKKTTPTPPKADKPKEEKKEVKKEVQKSAQLEPKTTSAEATKAQPKKTEQPSQEVKKKENNPSPAQKVEQANTPAKASDDQKKDAPESTQPATPESTINAKADELKGLTVVGKVDLSSFENRRKKKPKPVASSDDKNAQKKRKRKRVPVGNSENPQGKGGQSQGGNRPAGQGQGQGGNRPGGQGGNRPGGQGGNRPGGQGGNRPGGQGGNRPGGQGGANSGEKSFRNADATPNRGGTASKAKKKKGKVSEKDIQSGMKKANQQLNQSGFKSTRGKHKQAKRNKREAENEARLQKEAAEQHIITVTEFISTSELATMMDISVSDVIMTCMNNGMFISINQRLDKETIELITTEFNFEAKFTSAEEEVDAPLEKEDKPEELIERAPIVTIMGHVDHGKTSLLDYIRDENVASGEAGGITQHIGAYDVTTKSGKQIAFLDTPGHEAFTAMRARGAKVTDIAIIVVAADDQVMPQTKEAINHALSAEVPIVIAINKVDKPNANVENIKTQLSALNILVEDWGGKYQAFEISAKTGQGVDDLLDGLLLEAEVLELKANPNKNAVGTIVEASLDKGRGYLATVLVQAGTMRVGDVMLAGGYYGKVKAMLNHLGQRVKEAGPSTPVQVLGLSGAPQAGDKLNVLDTEREAREIANKREQLSREQSLRASQRPNLDLFKRLAQGELQQLNMIIKGDVDGSVEALSDSLLKLSNDEVEVRIIHKGVGALTESDILLAAADKENPTMIIGFQVRPTPNARKLAESEGIEVRHYSVIYNAIDDVKAAMEGLLEPDMEEKIVGNVEVREVFKISKVGTVAGCYVTDGYIKRNSKIRIVRDGVVIYGGKDGGEIGALKRFKDDVNEVKFGYECGMSINNYNDIKEGDIVEAFEITETKRKLKSN